MSVARQMIVINLASIACAISAGVIAFHGKSGWGWFLFAFLLLHVYPTRIGRDREIPEDKG